MSIRPKDENDFADALDEIANWATQQELYDFLANIIKEQVDKRDLPKFIENVQRRYK